MKYTIEVQPIHCEYGDYEFIARYEDIDGERLTNAQLKQEVVGYGLSELEAVSDLILATKEAIS